MDQIGIEDALIQKKIIYSGSKFVPLVNGTKVCIKFIIILEKNRKGRNSNFIFNMAGKIPLSNQNLLRE